VTHAEIVELLPFYINGTLADADRAAVERELADCGTCAAELDDLRLLSAALQQREAELPLSEPALAAIFARVPQKTHAERPWWTMPASYAAAFVLVFGGGVMAAELQHVFAAREAAVDGTGQPFTLADSGIMRVVPRTTLTLHVGTDAAIDTVTAQAVALLARADAMQLPVINRGQFDADLSDRTARATIAAIASLTHEHTIENDTVDIGSLIRTSEEYAITMRCAQQHLDAPNMRLCNAADTAYVDDAALLKRTAAITRLRVSIVVR
jgi:hypothetical protein